MKVVDQIRRKLKDGKLKNGEQIRSELKQSILELLRTRGGNTDLQLGDTQPSVILVVGVNGGGKTTTIGKLAHKFNLEGVKVRFESVAFQEMPCGLAVASGRYCLQWADLVPNCCLLQRALALDAPVASCFAVWVVTLLPYVSCTYLIMTLGSLVISAIKVFLW